jgi:hypothetical protein
MDAEITKSARELIERVGNEAVPYMLKRIKQLQSAGKQREADQAYQLLTEVERLFVEKT